MLAAVLRIDSCDAAQLGGWMLPRYAIRGYCLASAMEFRRKVCEFIDGLVPASAVHVRASDG